MHSPGLGQGQRLSHHAAHTLAKREVETLDCVGQAAALLAGLVLLLGNHRLVGCPEVGISRQLPLGLRQSPPQLAAGRGAAVSHHHRNYLPGLEGKGDPHPGPLAFAPHE